MAFRYYMTLWVGIGGICLVVGREWENFMDPSLYEPEVTLCLFIFVSCSVRVCSTHLSYSISVSSLVSTAKMAALPATGATVLNNIYTMTPIDSFSDEPKALIETLVPNL